MDRVSNLPDEVLCHILSFLPTKHAAFTSVLSKRWRNLIAFVPNLDIHSHNEVLKYSMWPYTYLHPDVGKPEEYYGTMRSFNGFIDRVLALQGDSPIKKASLKCINCVHPDHLDRWICNVLHRGVSDLELFIYDGDGDDDSRYNLPQEMFVSRTLVNLKLSLVSWWPGAEGTFLPRLKTLRINKSWDCKDKLEMLLPAFPVLEELYIESIMWIGLDDTVLSASLKKLTIHAYGFSQDVKGPKSICFNTPSLVYLKYSDYVADDYPKVDLTNLVEAVLDLNVRVNYFMLARETNNDVVLRCRNLWKLMSGIRNVQKLTFSSKTLELLSQCCESIPVFNNLKILGIRSGWPYGKWKAMPILLKNCPHLETLILETLYLWDCISWEDKDRWLIPCLVKKIQIKKFRGTELEMEMIKHLLESFPRLKEMEIHAETNGRTAPDDYSELVVKMVTLCKESYQVVVSTSWLVIKCIGK